MKKISSVTVLSFLALTTLNANDSLVNVKSTHSVEKTASKFIKIVKSKGVKVFAVIDHAVGAQSIDKKLRDTKVVIFGSPKMGTPLMQVNQTIGLDLPLKVLFWQDAKGSSWITYKKPKLTLASHNITSKDKIGNKMTNVLAKFTNKAAN